MTAPDALEIPPQVTADEVEALEKLLRTGAGWMSASSILVSRYLVPTESNKRILRRTAAESKWIISGQEGYKHLQQATPAEVTHFVKQMESQSRKMSERAGAIEINYRKIFQIV